jgi:hypothetical protein
MRAYTVVALFLSTLAIASPVADSSPADGLAARDKSGILQARSCTNNGCKCAKGVEQGQYCGW